MVNGTLQILADRHDLKIDAKWNGHSRVWTVRDCDNVHLFTTDDYSLLLRRLENGGYVRVTSNPPDWWPR